MDFAFVDGFLAGSLSKYGVIGTQDNREAIVEGSHTIFEYNRATGILKTTLSEPSLKSHINIGDFLLCELLGSGISSGLDLEVFLYESGFDHKPVIFRGVKKITLTE